ncbi:tail fiber domain-containing protein [Chitinophaga eiseniae]|uniref:Tail fiber domain-containing protein n=1 Tax=Chitinophaga eiseniae TaxID=634771 RepID=A0A847SSY5_9BACT|nr:tail fiber domain-containing protein [Chitinophaga eiseniae]NLR81198.1 tail fiber domain-containing protein [Chitinophaga eiseniae]
MKYFFSIIFFLFIGSFCYAQQVYQIKADSVRIYNTCDTAELILENRTQKVPGFLFNKGNGRTEFQKLSFTSPGLGLLGIQGQDTINLPNVLSPWADVRYDLLSTNFTTLSATDTMRWEQWYINKPIGYSAYSAPDMPVLSEQAFNGAGSNTYYNGLVVKTATTGFDFSVNWNGELTGPNGAFIRIKDDTQTKWSQWRELLFKDYADKTYVLNQKVAAQAANLWISGAAKVGDSVVLTRYKNNATGDSVLTTDGSGNLKLKLMTGGSGSGNIYTTDGTLMGDRLLNAGARSLSFKGVTTSKDSSYMLFNYSGIKLGTLMYRFVGGGVSELSTDMFNGSRITWSKVDTTSYILANSYGVGTNYKRGWIDFENNVNGNGIRWTYLDGTPNSGGNQLNFEMDTLGLRFSKSTTSSKDTLFTIDKYGTAIFNGQLEAQAIYQSSQRALKKDIAPFNKSALDIIDHASVQTFRYKSDKNELLHIGFIAEDVPEEMAAPKRVGVDQANTVAVLVKAIQEMNGQVKALKEEVKMLRKQLKDTRK